MTEKHVLEGTVKVMWSDTPFVIIEYPWLDTTPPGESRRTGLDLPSWLRQFKNKKVSFTVQVLE